MSIDIQSLIAEIEAAAASPGGLALRNVASLTAGQPNLRRALESAALPHWWDSGALAQLLPEDLAADVETWAQKLESLSVIEPFLARPEAHNVHEVTRQALRAQLHREGRLQEVSLRALPAFPPDRAQAADHLEYLFHLLSADPEAASLETELVWQAWNDEGRWQDLLNMAAMLEEALPFVTGLTLAWVQFCRVDIRFDHQPSVRLLDAAEASCKLFADEGEHRGLAKALLLAGAIRVWRGQAGDAEAALAHYERGLEISEKQLRGNPASAQAARDVSASLDRLGDYLAKRGQAGDAEAALAHYERGLEIREKQLRNNPASAQAARDVSLSLNRLGDYLEQRGQAGDAEAALAHYERGLEISEKQLRDNPASAQAARDVWVSCWRLATHAERTGQGDAMVHWRQAYSTLQGMKDQGMFLQAGDSRLLEILRTKVGDKCAG